MQFLLKLRDSCCSSKGIESFSASSAGLVTSGIQFTTYLAEIESHMWQDGNVQFVLIFLLLAMAPPGRDGLQPKSEGQPSDQETIPESCLVSLASGDAHLAQESLANLTKWV